MVIAVLMRLLAWESGNELSLIRFGDGAAPPSWTKEIGELVKSLAPRQLFSTHAFYNASSNGVLMY